MFGCKANPLGTPQAAPRVSGNLRNRKRSRENLPDLLIGQPSRGKRFRRAGPILEVSNRRRFFVQPRRNIGTQGRITDVGFSVFTATANIHDLSDRKLTIILVVAAEKREENVLRVRMPRPYFRRSKRRSLRLDSRVLVFDASKDLNFFELPMWPAGEGRIGLNLEPQEDVEADEELYDRTQRR